MQGVRHYTYGEIFATRRQLDFKVSMGICTQSVPKIRTMNQLKDSAKDEWAIIGITIAAEYTDGYRIESFDKHANYVNQFWSAYENKRLGPSLSIACAPALQMINHV